MLWKLKDPAKVQPLLDFWSKALEAGFMKDKGLLELKRQSLLLKRIIKQRTNEPETITSEA